MEVYILEIANGLKITETIEDKVVYPSYSLSATASFKNPMLDITVNGELAYGLTTVYADSIVFLNVAFYSSVV